MYHIYSYFHKSNTMTDSPTSTASPPFHPASLLCQKDGNSDDPLPAICTQIFQKLITNLPENIKNISIIVVNNELIGTNMLLEILKYLGLFIGMLASLAFLTLLLCHRSRKVETQDENPPHSQVFTLRQLNLYIIQPPAYDTVLRREEEGLPTYQEAVKRGEEETFA